MSVDLIRKQKNPRMWGFIKKISSQYYFSIDQNSSPCRSMLQVINGGWIQLPEQFEEVSFAHSPFFLL